MILNIETFNYDKDLFKISSEIRYKIFVDELGGDKFSEFDSFDLTAIHYLVYFNNLPIGVARAVSNIDNFYIDKIGILKNYRSQGFGTVLLRFIIKDLKHANKDLIVRTSENNFKFFEINHFTIKEKINENSLEMIFI